MAALKFGNIESIKESCRDQRTLTTHRSDERMTMGLAATSGLVRQSVDNDVDANRVAARREQVEEVLVVSLALPGV
jgi:hypothetical protein